MISDLLERPVIFLDVESTGTSVSRDRIVQIAMLKMQKDMEPIEFKIHINPGIPCHPDAIAIHGLTDEFLKQFPSFQERAKLILSFIGDADLAGHNIFSFDLQIMIEEFLRCGVQFPEPEVRILDTMRIQEFLSPRTLEFLYMMYTQEVVDPKRKHDAMDDVKMCAAIFMKQIEFGEDKLGILTEDIHRIGTRGRFIIDYAGFLAVDHEGQLIFTGGKNKGNRVMADTSYVSWCIDKGEFTQDTKRWLKLCQKYGNDYKTIRDNFNAPAIIQSAIPL